MGIKLKHMEEPFIFPFWLLTMQTHTWSSHFRLKMKDVLASRLEFNNHVITAVEPTREDLWLVSTPYLLNTILYKYVEQILPWIYNGTTRSSALFLVQY